MISAFYASTFGEGAVMAPECYSPAVLWLLRLYTVTGYPACNKCGTIGMPIFPSLIQPILVVPILLMIYNSESTTLCPKIGNKGT
ncbi:hypothetical protein DCM91_12195 [Chitinophaga costaii]|nr:hypothetical protein DCM91_12195 [Chitinophaga costaii]